MIPLGPSARAAAATLLAAALACSAHAECKIKGQVASKGVPVPSADIVEDVVGERNLGATNGRGEFEVSPSAISARRLQSIVVVRAAGFEPLTLSLAPDAARCPVLNRSVIELARTSANAAVSISGTTLYVAPYELTGPGGTALDSAKFNQTLLYAIYTKVNAFLSSLEQSTPLPEMGVRALQTRVAFTDPEAVRTAGTEVNALGVITGFAEAVADATPSVRVSSEFRVIPVYPAYREYHLQISDSLPGTTLNPLELSNRMQDVWGERATIALLVQTLAAASAAHDKEQMQIVRGWIVALRNAMRADEDHLARELAGLLTDVDEELRK
jgi:hypothetical protein